MEKTQEETQLKLDKKQRQSIINNEIMTRTGLKDMFSMKINHLMLSERKSFLRDHTAPTTKGNEYRQASRSEIGVKLTSSVPGDRLSVFNPFYVGGIR